MTPQIYLKKNEERRIKGGHLWIFSNEIQRTQEEPQNGDVVEIYDFKEQFLGSGFFNKNSLISVRLLSNIRIDDLFSLFRERILTAYELRKILYPDRKSYRLVFSESDFMPGLIIDKYNNTFVLQVYSYGIQKNIDLIIRILKEDLSAENIFTKNESYFRMLEGLPVADEIYLGEIIEEIISDGKVNFKIDFRTGQKTGFYFDQSDNRFIIEKFSKGKSVLDAFCNAGGFGLHAASAGAESVTFIDSSGTAIENAKVNFELNKLNCKTEFITGDVFEYLEKCSNSGKKFDLVILDPPAFAKSKKNLPTAKKGYEKLNRLALNIVNQGGFLATSSCSYHLPEKDFIQVINSASMKSGRKIQLIKLNGASLDHPRLPSMDETSYLKFAVLHVM
jgi:23S rRNA (cytosine1962-C5)-methyltransferase